MIPSLEVILLSLAVAADATAVCIGWSLAAGRGAFRRGIAMPVAFGLAQSGMAALGYGFGATLSGAIGEAFEWVAVGVLGLLGLRMLWQANKQDEVEETERLTLWLITLLAVVTSIDALAVGVSLSALTDEPMLAIGWIGVVTLVMSLLGLGFGASLGSRFGDWGERIGGLVLIGLAIRLAVAG